MIEEDPQQTIFSTAQGHHGALRIQQMTGGGIELPVAENQELRRLTHLQIHRQHAGTAQHRTDPREQLTHCKRFAQVIVGAHFQADDAIRFFTACGQHQDRYRAPFAGA
ncbi:hypothetical protein D3C81_1745200 [compost metagenome]